MYYYDGQRRTYTPWSQFAILLALSGGGLLLGAFLGAGIATAYLHVSFKDLPEALEKSKDANLLRSLQFISTLFFMAIPSIVFARIINAKPFKNIGFSKAISGKQVFIVIGIVLLGLTISLTLSSVNQMIPLWKSAEQYFKLKEDQYSKEMMAIASMKTTSDYIISLIMIALLPAIFEEMLFRGALQPVMISLTKNAFIGILITSILFSAIHASYYGFLPRLALGLIIGYIFYYSKNLWLSSITHCLYNAIGVTELYLASKNGKLSPETMDNDSLPLLYGLVAAVLLFALFKFFKRESEVVISMYNLENTTKQNE